MTQSQPDLLYDILTCEFGSLLIAASGKGLRFIRYFDTEAAARIDGWVHTTGAVRDRAHMEPYLRGLVSFLQGKRRALDLPLDLEGGTELQRRVWRELCKIPYGSTITYSDLAARVNYPNAIRAVASACGRNPLPLIIPCHRVVAKDGGLGGFAWGLDKKAQLLQLEMTVAPEAA